jgi:N-hydroxyarylamine O-acetyltransferase
MPRINPAGRLDQRKKRTKDRIVAYAAGTGVSDTVDLEAYFARIGYSGPRAPSLATLRALHALHPSAIAFENLDPLLRRPVRLDLSSLQKKLIAEKRGGYCFEQNGFFASVLSALGFKVTTLSARVFFGRMPGHTRRSHMLLKVELDEGDYIADVGFGGQSPSAPLQLDNQEEQATPHRDFRVARSGEYFELHADTGNEWKALYRFSLEEQSPEDHEMANWYISTHPDSDFISHLLVSRLPPGRRLGLFNNQFSIRHSDGRLERRELKGAEELAVLLETEFMIALPEPREELLQALARVIG